MGKYGFSFGGYGRSGRYWNDCPCDNETPHPPFPPYPPFQPFTASYIEAVGNTQDIAEGGDVVFDVNPDFLDVAGYGIELDSTGTEFTITRPGLYQIEWSVNVGQSAQPLVLGLLENGNPASGLSNSIDAGKGNFSSGALINVTESDVPLKIRLHNFGGALSLENPVEFENTSASIRILRFANGPDVIR